VQAQRRIPGLFLSQAWATSSLSRLLGSQNCGREHALRPHLHNPASRSARSHPQASPRALSGVWEVQAQVGAAGGPLWQEQDGDQAQVHAADGGGGGVEASEALVQRRRTRGGLGRTNRGQRAVQALTAKGSRMGCGRPVAGHYMTQAPAMVA
jgi:hypothetical protein